MTSHKGASLSRSRTPHVQEDLPHKKSPTPLGQEIAHPPRTHLGPWAYAYGRGCVFFQAR